MLGAVLLVTDQLMREAAIVRSAVLVGDPGETADVRSYADSVRAWNSSVRQAADDPHVETALSEAQAHSAGASLATRLHLEAVAALHTPAEEPTATAHDVEYELQQVLSTLRSASRDQSLLLVNVGLNRLGGVLYTALMDAARGCDPTTGSVVDGLEVVQISQLARRRAAAVAAGAVELQRRMTSSRLRTTTAGIAERRATVLDRTGLDLLELRTSLGDLAEGDRTGLLAFVSGSAWVDRPERPYTRVDLALGGELRVHFKNARLVGFAENQWLWGRCKGEGETDSGVPYAVAEFEGPTGDADEIWENWLQVEVRQVYDVAPSSIHAHVAFAPPGTPAAALDLTARIDAGETS